jgi:RNA polymerase sigma-70 factor (ECF subfamily)
MRTDAELLRQARDDAGAFRALYERYATRIYGYHLRRSGDPHAAHDLTAESFAQAWIARGSFRDVAGGSAGPWLYAIARNVLVDSVRRGQLERGARDRLGLVQGREESRVEAAPEERWLEGLDEALAELPAGQQDAIRLRIVDDLAYDDVADALGTTTEAARVRVHRGLAALRTRLTDTTEASR